MAAKPTKVGVKARSSVGVNSNRYKGGANPLLKGSAAKASRHRNFVPEIIFFSKGPTRSTPKRDRVYYKKFSKRSSKRFVKKVCGKGVRVLNPPKMIHGSRGLRKESRDLLNKLNIDKRLRSMFFRRKKAMDARLLLLLGMAGFKVRRLLILLGRTSSLKIRNAIKAFIRRSIVLYERFYGNGFSYFISTVI